MTVVTIVMSGDGEIVSVGECYVVMVAKMMILTGTLVHMVVTHWDACTHGSNMR